MIIEQYRLILQHRIIDTEKQDLNLGKLEPDYIAEYNSEFGKSTVPKSEAINRLMYSMREKMDRLSEV